MQKIEEYILLPASTRRAHLKLDSPCIFRRKKYPKPHVGHDLRELLAFITDTSIPEGCRIHCCHACYNENCSNPYHLYWGTPKENYSDTVSSGRWIHPRVRLVERYGEEKTKKMMKRGKDLKPRKKHKPRSEEYREQVRKRMLAYYANKRQYNIEPRKIGQLQGCGSKAQN